MSDRTDVTEKIVAARLKKNLKWDHVASELGVSKAWAAAACLGQMEMSRKQAQAAARLFDLSEDEAQMLTYPPARSGAPSSVPNDPLLYRLHEMFGVYGEALRSIIHEEFGDGVMSAIDFSVDVQKVHASGGDRVKLVLNGKFLPYKAF